LLADLIDFFRVGGNPGVGWGLPHRDNVRSILYALR